MEKRIPFIVFGDGPRNPTGLGRIARDLTARLSVEQEELGIRLAQVGVDEPDGWHWQGWDFYGFQPTMKDQGRLAVTKACLDLEKETGERPVVMAITDPSRVYDLTRPAQAGEEIDPVTDIADLWGYFPIDAVNVNDAIGGPAAHAIWEVDRVHGYGRWGAHVLRRTLQQQWAERRSPGEDEQWKQVVTYLPHGLEPGVFVPTPLHRADDLFQAWYHQLLIHAPQTLVIGCVATNQPRKDLALLFAAAAKIREQGRPCAVWLHTDSMVKGAWSVSELARSFAFDKRSCLASCEEITDRQLAARYSSSTATLAPGLGEGFGYPIVESLSCGTPVVHGHYAGGAGLVPDPRWLVDAAAWRIESVYAQLRPVFQPEAVAAALLEACHARLHERSCMAFCMGSVAHLSWQALWPRWRGWVAKGLDHVRRQRADERAGGAAGETSAPQSGDGADVHQPPDRG
jgi:glycosyltransferase involved in cell wall biosynthesis